ncbi:MAG: CRISPR-associated endoribonuclease Cas6 [Bacteroidetes bacterium]|jgi:CRISPR-associated endoribonuclease Cas6|nr:CRISPR-associated endoribonuclease Cas6 [Bacteroidota bacterium]
MRVKISFTRDNNSGNTIPLHHQKLIFDSLSAILKSIGEDRHQLNFSSLKGTSKIHNGFMKFLSSKITLIVSSSNETLVTKLVDHIFSNEKLTIGRMNLVPKNRDVIPDPEFTTQMRYLCISPLVLLSPAKDTKQVAEQVDPQSSNFSDILFNLTLDTMEKSGIPESVVSTYSEFDIQADAEYLQKMTGQNKKYIRTYRTSDGKNISGYLLPFTLHAHPDVHKFVWQNGMGALTHEGYGMLDLVK